MESLQSENESLKEHLAKERFTVRQYDESLQLLQGPFSEGRSEWEALLTSKTQEAAALKLELDSANGK